MPRPYPAEFRDDVVRVVRNREDGVTIEQSGVQFRRYIDSLDTERQTSREPGAFDLVDMSITGDLELLGHLAIGLDHACPEDRGAGLEALCTQISSSPARGASIIRHCAARCLTR